MNRFPARGNFALIWAVALSCLCGGCERSFYRRQADIEALSLIAEHAQDPRWNLPNMSVEVDEQSRMYDPFCRDMPPMPPDDPTAHRLMHCVDGKQGFPCWHASGDTETTENPHWLDFLPLDENGALEIDADSSVRLARRHSRNYQLQLEELYLSALDVSFERFRFDTQLMAGYGLNYTADGPARSDSGGESSSTLTATTNSGGHDWQIRKLYSTGSELIVSFANELVWQFSGPDTQSATTLLSFSFLQPLLREAGRDRILERLTLAERLLLANVREMERYRQAFYVEIQTGRDAGAGPQRSGGVFGGSGLEGFSGVGAGGFGRVTTGVAANTTGTGQVGGFLGLVQQQQQIRNQEANIVALRSSLAQLEAFFQASRIDYFQVELARQALYNAQSQLLVANTQHASALDAHKLRLGLPPKLKVKVSDTSVSSFNLIDVAIKNRQACLTLQQEELTPVLRPYLETLQKAREAAEKITPPAEPALEWNDDWGKLLSRLQEHANVVEQERKRIVNEVLPHVEADLSRFEAAKPKRQSELARLKARYQEMRQALTREMRDGECQSLPYFDEALFDPGRPAELAKRLRTSFHELQNQLAQRGLDLQRVTEHIESLQSSRTRPANPTALFETLREKIFFGREGDPVSPSASPREAIPTLPGVEAELAAHLVSLSVIQAEARAELASLVDVRLVEEEALQLARDNRLDWMNARAALVNSWRLIEFNADALEGSLDVVFRGDIQNTGSNPFNLNDSTGRLQVGVQFDTPITRLRERNTYRQSQLEFQQARRSYYAFEDQVSRSLRDSLRSVDLHNVNFELRRAAVHVAARQVDFATLRLQAPPKPGDTANFGATTARDLVSALSDLLNAQNDFLAVWVNYESLRRGLALDLGTMQLDEDGIWVDPGEIGPATETAPSLQQVPSSPRNTVGSHLAPARKDGAVVQAGYHEAAESIPSSRVQTPQAHGTAMPAPPPPGPLRLRR